MSSDPTGSEGRSDAGERAAGVPGGAGMDPATRRGVRIATLKAEIKHLQEEVETLEAEVERKEAEVRRRQDQHQRVIDRYEELLTEHEGGNGAGADRKADGGNDESRGDAPTGSPLARIRGWLAGWR